MKVSNNLAIVYMHVAETMNKMDHLYSESQDRDDVIGPFFG